MPEVKGFIKQVIGPVRDVEFENGAFSQKRCFA